MKRSGIAVLTLAALALPASPALAAPLDRPDDPVVITGAGVPSLTGVAPAKILAFAWSGSWDQIPVQVDERKLMDLRVAYPTPFPACSDPCYTPFSTPAKLRYADPGTRVGADTDPALDSDDEIAFMARDTGTETDTASDPAGVVAGSRVEIVVTDPLDGGAGYVYLFRQTGSIDPGAGEQYVTYNFNLTSGAYPATYDHATGLNPETSTVVTPNYTRRFTDRWQETELKILRGPATEADILDRNENQFIPDVLRTQPADLRPGRGRVPGQPQRPRPRDPRLPGREQRADDRAPADLLRGPRGGHHLPAGCTAIPAVMSFLDYSAAATGMTYRNTNNPVGVTIDGVADSVVAGPLTWESVDGVQGALTSVHTWSTTLAAEQVHLVLP